MIRTTITMEDPLVEELDAYMQRSGASSRSEAIRDLVRRGLNSHPIESSQTECIGILSYTINQTIPGLTKRIRLERLERHDEIIFSASVPADHTHSIDIVVMRGMARAVSDYAHGIFLERGVKHGTIGMMPVTEVHSHSQDEDGERKTHVHLKVQESF